MNRLHAAGFTNHLSAAASRRAGRLRATGHRRRRRCPTIVQLRSTASRRAAGSSQLPTSPRLRRGRASLGVQPVTAGFGGSHFTHRFDLGPRTPARTRCPRLESSARARSGAGLDLRPAGGASVVDGSGARSAPPASSGDEDAAVNDVINALIDPAGHCRRHRRYPDRSLRVEMLNATITGWVGMEAIAFRLSCDAKLDKHRASLVERRVVAGRLNRPGWNGDETDACHRQAAPAAPGRLHRGTADRRISAWPPKRPLAGLQWAPDTGSRPTPRAAAVGAAGPLPSAAPRCPCWRSERGWAASEVAHRLDRRALSPPHRWEAPVHPKQERVAVIVSQILRSAERREAPTPLSIARTSGFTVRTVERHWGEAVNIAAAQRRTNDAKPR